MDKDITYCDYLCPYESCERNLYNLEGISKDEFENISITQFEDCVHYGSTEGMYVPMWAKHYGSKRMKGADDE